MNDALVAGISAYERALGDRSTRIGLVAPHRLATMSLTAEEGFVLSRMERPLRVADLLQICGLSEERALQVLLNLFLKGAVLIGDEAVEPPAPPPPPQSPYGDFVFTPSELQEPADLDQEKKKLILFLFHNLARLSHYRILGVSPGASAADVRKAFLEKSKEFHPDSFFRKRLGSYTQRIEAIFHRIKAAHDTLMDDEARHRYDREAKHFTSEEVAALSRAEIERLEDERRARVRRERLLRAKGFARLTMARELMAGADAALADGNVKDAMHGYQLAGEMDPRLDDARTKLAEARRIATVQRADAAVAQADRVEQEGDRARAVGLLRSAVEADAGNARVHGLLAGVLLRSGTDLPEARVHAQRAIDLGDRSGSARVRLGEILLALGQKRAARTEFKTALAQGETRAEELLKQT